MDIQFLMKQAKKLEKAMADAREKLGEVVVEGESGGGLVKVTLSGKGAMTALDIDASLLKPEAQRWRAALLVAPRPNHDREAATAAPAWLQQIETGADHIDADELPNNDTSDIPIMDEAIVLRVLDGDFSVAPSATK